MHAIAHRPRPADPTNAAAKGAAAFAHFAATAPVMVCALDHRGRFVVWNEECRRVTGFALGDLQGARWRRLFGDAGSARRWAGEVASRRGRRFRDWTWSVRASSGDRRVLSWNAGAGRSPVRGCAMWAIGRDVTEVATMRQRLAETQENLTAAQVTAGIGVWDLDPGTGRVRWTPELEQLLGFHRGGFRGTFDDFLAIMHPDDRAGFLRRYREHVARGERASEDQFRTVAPDGTVRIIRSRWHVLHVAGAAPRVVGTSLDVTRAVETESALEEKDAYLRVALQSTKLILFRQDRQLRYTWVANPRLGFTESDFLGRTDTDLLPTDEIRRLVTVKRRVIRTGRGASLKFWLNHGQHRNCFEQVMEPQRDGTGRVVGLVGAALDITDSALAQEKLEHAKHELQKLATHLQDAVESERRNMAQDVHDHVGSVLTGIRMGLANLVHALPQGGDQRRDEINAIIAMTDTAVASTREIATRLRPPSLEDVGLAETCRWFVQDWSRATGLRTTANLPRRGREPRPEVAIDLFRCLQELLANVARHARASNVRVSLRSLKARWCLVVQDDGRGFDPQTATPGFGLAGLRERAARHGGRLQIESGDGGTTVTICVPRGGGGK